MRFILSIALLLISGCADLGYYWHSARGHLGVMSDRVSIDKILADDETSPELRERLLLVQEIRAFSIERLDLPDNDSYRSFVQLENPYVLQNLFAAPEFSTRLHQWCYPIIGCASYRGYYDNERLEKYSARLKQEGFEIHIGKVSAYSTLGWFDDPVLSSFINWSDYRLAGLIFHELTHQQIYIDNDTTFNESLASAVQQAGTELWLEHHDKTEQLEGFQRWLVYREQVIELIIDTQRALNDLYQNNIEDDQKRISKQEIFETAKQKHQTIAEQHGVTAGFTRWFTEDLNNAKVGSVAAYNTRVKAFLQILNAHQKRFTPFYEYIERLSELARKERDQCLDWWQSTDAGTDNPCPQIVVSSN
ncbi:MAG: aminopeptidase [Pseudomonadota bacterium]